MELDARDTEKQCVYTNGHYQCSLMKGEIIQNKEKMSERVQMYVQLLGSDDLYYQLK